MRRPLAKILGAIVVSFFLAIPFVNHVLPQTRQQVTSGTRDFRIDGREFRAEEFTGTDLEVMTEIWKGNGWDIETKNASFPSAPPVSNEILKEHSTFNERQTKLPQGFVREHSVRLGKGSGEVEILIGSINEKGPAVRNRLIENGWRQIPSALSAEGMQVVSTMPGREKCIVFLDEKEAKFLFARESKAQGP